MKRGAVLLIDEVDRGSNKLMCLQGILEGKPYYNKKNGEMVYPAEGFNVVATANTKGRGSEEGRYLSQILDDAFLERFLKNQDVTLFSYHECPSLWNTFGLEGFKEKYEKAEANKNIKFKKKVPARELMGLLAKERLETGRIYTMFVDHANEHGSWLDQVDMICELITTTIYKLKFLK